jgi:hypothetical protein
MAETSQFDVDAVAAMHASGISLNKITRMPGMPKSVHSLSRALKAAGHTVKQYKGILKDLTDERLIALYLDQGFSCREIAAIFNCSTSPIKNRVRGLGISRPTGWALRGSNNPFWKGGRLKSSAGYVHLLKPGHPMACRKGYVLEHRLVASEHLGRMLGRKEEVHHLNGIKDDNRWENLVVVQSGKHQKLHADHNRKVWALQKRVELLEAMLHRGESWKVVG